MRILILLTLALLLTRPAARAQRERIVRFDSDIKVAADTSLTVTEHITVFAAGDRIKRGIFRDFPQLYAAGTGLRRKRGFEVLEVTKDGRPEKFAIENLSRGKRVRIGSADRFLRTGNHTYKIRYRTTRQLGYFGTHDELYWNVTGNGWDFAMESVSATVTLPPGADVKSAEAYTGAAGGNGGAYKVTSDGGVARFLSTAPLGPHEGMTVVVTFVKDHVDYAADRTGPPEFLRDNIGLTTALLALVAALLYFVLRWWAVGRDPPAGTMVPRYDPPDGFSPAAVRVLNKMAFDDQVFSAAVIGLAAKGHIDIAESGDTYKLKPMDGKGSEALTGDEQALMKSLIGEAGSVELAQKNHTRIRAGMMALNAKLDAALKGSHYHSNTWTWAIGLLIFALPAGVGFLMQGPEALAYFGVCSVVSMFVIGGALEILKAFRLRRGRVFRTLFLVGAIVGLGFALRAHAAVVGPLLAAVAPLGVLAITVFHHLMKAPTRLGRQRLDEIAGFRHYLSVAEVERLNFQNPPERTPALFERFLPYALALDVEQKWSEGFADVLAAASADGGDGAPKTYTPSFYRGSNFNGLAVGAMATAIGSTLASNLASSSSSPSSSSGSSGGGFSGGGGGGGGGGGW